MSNERDELAKVIHGAPALIAWEGQQHIIAASILAAGYTKPRQVSTVEELDALPVGSVAIEADGYIARRFPGGWRVLVTEPHRSPWLSGTLEDVRLPATVLYSPARP